MSMGNGYKEQLQRQYDFCVSLDEKGFFLGLADYVKFIVETPPLVQIVENFILEEHKKDTEEFENLKRKVRQELEESAKKLLKEIQKKKITSPELEKAIEEYKGLKEGRIQQSIPLENSYHEALARIVRSLRDLGYKNIVTRFAKINPSNGLIEEYTLSKNYLKYLQEKQHQEYLKEISIWSSWYHLVWVYQAIYRRKELEQERDTLSKKNYFFESVNITLLIGAMQKILSDQPDNLSHFFFNKTKYIVHLNRVHNYFMGHIESIIPISTEEPYLDTQNRVLQYRDIIHRFQKGRENSNVYRLFAHLWEFHQRRHISGMVLKQGEAFPKYALPENLEMTPQAINDALKSIKRILARGFPVKLKIANGVQLIVTTKRKK
jgi:hypothetical protein